MMGNLEELYEGIDEEMLKTQDRKAKLRYIDVIQSIFKDEAIEAEENIVKIKKDVHAWAIANIEPIDPETTFIRRE